MTQIGKILIIDDEDVNVDIIKDTLEDVGYLVKTASNSIEAKALIQEFNFDLIMLDVWMPGQDGMSLLRELKENGNTNKIVMMSGHAEHTDIVEAIKIGALDFIKKPIYDILPLIRNILNQENISNNIYNNLNQPFKDAKINFEKCYFDFHMKNNNNNISKVAQISGVDRTTLYRKLKDLIIEK